MENNFKNKLFNQKITLTEANHNLDTSSTFKKFLVDLHNEVVELKKKNTPVKKETSVSKK